MDMNDLNFSLLFDGSQEAIAVIRDKEILYANRAVGNVLSALPLSLVLMKLPSALSGNCVTDISLFGHSFEICLQDLGDCQLLRIHSAAKPPLIHSCLMTELRNLIQSQEFTLTRLLEGISSRDNDLYGSAVRRNFYGLLNFTERLGDMSQLSEGSVVLKPELFELGQLFSDTLLTLKIMLPEKYPFPTLTVEEECYLVADPLRVEEMLLYLLSNSLLHTPKSGSIHIRIRNEKDHALIFVEDSGSGISSETLAHIFDTDADPLHCTHIPMGLKLAKGIAGSHRGNLLIRSGEGAGTQVLVSLPNVPKPKKPVGDCIPPESMRSIKRIMVNIFDITPYRDVFDD